MIFRKLLTVNYCYMLMTLVFQHKDIIDIESTLKKNFSMLCDWFVDNKLSIHFGENNTK